MDWSPVAEGRLLTGDCKSAIFLWEPREGGRWQVDQGAAFSGHAGSVEDLQWRWDRGLGMREACRSDDFGESMN